MKLIIKNLNQFLLIQQRTLRMKLVLKALKNKKNNHLKNHLISLTIQEKWEKFCVAGPGHK